MSFLQAVARVIGPHAVVPPTQVTRASKSLAQWKGRLPGVVRATSADEVALILEVARAHGASVAPWSRGRNWGYGTRLAPSPRTYGLDLSGMDQIRGYDPRTGTVTVEPGVSQGQLSSWLLEHGADHYLDVTGAGPETSVLGNTLERGIAYNSLRAESLRHLEVVLADGRQIRTGFGWLGEGPVADGYRHGVGPNVTELFLQSNLGVVTAATLALRPRPEHRLTLRMVLRRQDDLPEFLEALATQKRRLGLQAIFHIGDQERSLTTFAPTLRARAASYGWPLDRAEAEAIVRRAVPAGWLAAGQLEGTKGQCRAAVRSLRRGLGAHAKITTLREGHLRLAAALARRLGWRERALLAEAAIEMSGLTCGRSTAAPLRAIAWPFEDDDPSWAEPEHGRAGWLLMSPLFPPWGGHLARVRDVVEQEARRHRVRTGWTVNLLTGDLAQAVVSLAWRRFEPGAGDRAHACQRSATERLLSLGYPPYRVALGEMAALQRAGADTLDVAARLKAALDPDGVIAPGRYVPEPASTSAPRAPRRSAALHR